MSSNPARLSTNNPFRTPVVTPNPTGASASSSAPPYSSLVPPSVSGPPSYSDPHSDDEESPEALPDLTPTIPSARPSQFVAQNTGLSTSSLTPPALPRRPSSSTPASSLSSNRPYDPPPSPPADGIPETAPPAYSVTPNSSGGELVVEQGPRRPFQRAPEPFLQPPPQNQQQGQGQQQQQRLQPPQSQPPRFAPPPGPPGSSPERPERPERPHSQLSDFAQDFYNAGPTAAQPQQPRYAPPPGPPPPQRPRAASTSSGAGSTAPSASDGRPTTTPTPGHPLLRNGKTLVYPENYMCPKCMFLTRLSPAAYRYFIPSNVKKVRIRATRTMTHLTHVASAGTASARHLPPFLPRARGVPGAAGQRVRVRASMAARSSVRCLHSSLHKHSPHGRSQRPACILQYLPQGCRVPREQRLCRLAVCPLQARPSSCRAIHVSAGGCAGGVVDGG